MRKTQDDVFVRQQAVEGGKSNDKSLTTTKQVIGTFKDKEEEGCLPKNCSKAYSVRGCGCFNTT